MRIALAALLTVSAAFTTQAAAQQPSRERYTEPTEPIVVTGIRVRDYRDRLAACLARHCPPNEDIDATLALAEAQFLNGDYGDARSTVRASLGRNRNQASAYPEPVSDLYRSYGRVSRHLGFDREALQAAHGILNSLQAGLPTEDYRHFTARFEIADAQMVAGRYNSARGQLDQLARIARAQGREDVAVMAELRDLWFQLIVNRNGDARSRLIEMSRLTDPGRRLQSVGAKVLLARLYRSEGDNARADTLLAEIGRGTSAQRRLLYMPRFQLMRFDPNTGLDSIDAQIAFGNVRNRISENYEGKWIDVGFWVLPDGHVADLEVLRSGGDRVWPQPLLEAIRGRIYSTGTEPTYRLERYSLIAAREQGTGTRIVQHSPAARVEYLDLTVSNPPPPPPASPTGGSV
jgi:hypothetical protein